MIATITNHISHGVTNIDDTSIKNMWYGANFNMPVKDYTTGTIVRYQGAQTYDTETTSYNLSGLSAGHEVCNGVAIWDFENNSGSTYDIDTYLYLKWADPSGTTIYWLINGYHFTYSLPAGYYYTRWQMGNIGIADWEINTNGNYHFIASASGTPSITAVDTSVAITNCPSVTQLSSDKAGYIWVEGNNLCYINANRWKHTIIGNDISSTPGTAKKGYIWIDSHTLHWVGSDGHDYAIPWAVKQFASFYSNGPTGEVNAGTSKKGSIWVDNQFGWTHLSFIASDGYKWLCGSGVNPLP